MAENLVLQYSASGFERGSLVSLAPGRPALMVRLAYARGDHRHLLPPKMRRLRPRNLEEESFAQDNGFCCPEPRKHAQCTPRRGRPVLPGRSGETPERGTGVIRHRLEIDMKTEGSHK
jgi:hypothetical protein